MACAQPDPDAARHHAQAGRDRPARNDRLEPHADGQRQQGDRDEVDESLGHAGDIPARDLVAAQVDAADHLRHGLEREHEREQERQRRPPLGRHPVTPEHEGYQEHREDRTAVQDGAQEQHPGRGATIRGRQHIAMELPEGRDQGAQGDACGKGGVASLAHRAQAPRDQHAGGDGRERLEDLAGEGLNEGRADFHARDRPIRRPSWRDAR